MLDLLGDVGGLFEALKLFAESILYFAGPGGLSAFLVGKLFYFPLRVASRARANSFQMQDLNSFPQDKVLNAHKHS